MVFETVGLENFFIEMWKIVIIKREDTWQHSLLSIRTLKHCAKKLQ